MKTGSIPFVISIVPVTLLPAIRDDIDNAAPPVHEVRTAIDIAASPQRVWPFLFNLDGFGKPDAWFFRMGVACPIGTWTHGNNRVCRLTTGDLVEVIVERKPAEVLRWKVIESPPTMLEWNPFGDPHPPHLDGTFEVVEGEFRLVAGPGKSTRLIGTTWYRNKMKPEGYWNYWCEVFVRGVQERVMQLISVKATANSATTPAALAGSPEPASGSRRSSTTRPTTATTGTRRLGITQRGVARRWPVS
ncbi:MAG: SRPBCC family protein [Armatimonadetes bacterium]|nr:SRPBCC family protein [Armatimonadota bacterium]